jgi:hypothetical protein
MAAGMFYWLAPRLWKTQLWSKALADMHFWVGLTGILLYIVAMWFSGISHHSSATISNGLVELVGALQQQLHRRQEFILHGAAKAAVSEFHHPAVELLLGAEAATADQVGIDANLAEFIHQYGQPYATGQEQLAQQGRFACP